MANQIPSSNSGFRGAPAGKPLTYRVPNRKDVVHLGFPAAHAVAPLPASPMTEDSIDLVPKGKAPARLPSSNRGR